MTHRGDAISGAAFGGERASGARFRIVPFGRVAAAVVPAVCVVGLLVAARHAAADNVYSFKDRTGTMHFTNVPTDQRFKAVPEQTGRPIRISYTGRIGGVDAASRSARGFARADRIWNEPPADLEKLIADTSRRYGVEAALVQAVVRAESAFDHLAVSSAGAQGLMQLMPGTAQEIGVRDVFHPKENLEGGVYYLRSLLDRFNGDYRLALAGYNAGPGAVERFGGVPPYAETMDYVERVFRYRQEYLLSQRARPQRVLVASR